MNEWKNEWGNIFANKNDDDDNNNNVNDNSKIDLQGK